MSIFTAMTNSVTGLRSQSFALENISDNIANSQTVGYKRVDTSFQDLVSDAPLRRQTGGSVAAFSRSTNGITGAVSSSGVPTHFALNGEEFVTVRDKTGETGGTATFGLTEQFTRRGDFELDRDGYMVNGAGKYLVGYQLDPFTGKSTSATPEVIKAAVSLAPAKATSTLVYEANLPATPKTNTFSPATAGSDVWAAGTPTSPATEPPAVLTPTSTPSSASFADNSIPGEVVAMYDAKGERVEVEFRWAKFQDDAAGDAWAMYYNSAPGSTAAASTWTRVATARFDGANALTAPTAAVNVDMSARGLGVISIDMARKLSQFGDETGQAGVRTARQDGYPAGKLDAISVSEDGRVVANFTNGQSQAIARIAVAQFNAPNMLRRGSGSAFEATLESGAPLFGDGDVALIGGSLEGSNTDIAEEFSKMIVTQQAYSANTRVISTAQQLLQETINIVR